MTYRLHKQWLQLAGIMNTDEKLEEISRTLELLPEGNRDNLRYVIKFMNVVASYQNLNKMSEYNLAVVMGPNLLWNEIDDFNIRMAENNVISNLVEFMIRNANTIFPGDEDFSVQSPAVVVQKDETYQTIQPMSAQNSKNQPMSAQKMEAGKPKAEGHYRKSSYDGNLQNNSEALQAGFTEQPTYATIEKTTKLRKNKPKAPLPPQRPPPTPTTVPATRPTSTVPTT